MFRRRLGFRTAIFLLGSLAFPYISRDFHGSSLDSLSWVLNGYSILFAAVLVPAGRWADRIGRRRMFMAGLVERRNPEEAPAADRPLHSTA